MGRIIPLTPRACRILKKQRRKFVKKFGREPGPDDPVFFDPNSDTPRPMTQQQMADYDQYVIEAMTKSALPPQCIYAYKRTGLLVTESNRQCLPADRLAEWESAVDEYFDLLDSGKLQ